MHSKFHSYLSHTDLVTSRALNLETGTCIITIGKSREEHMTCTELKSSAITYIFILTTYLYGQVMIC